MKASKNFTWDELHCKGCHRDYCKYDAPMANISQPSIDKLQKLRNLCGVPLYVNSAARCLEHNDAVGGSKTSQHLSKPELPSTAFDIRVPKEYCADTMVELAIQAGFKGIGIYPTFIHVDDRPRKARWDMR